MFVSRPGPQSLHLPAASPPPPALPPLPGILGAGGTSDARLAGEAPAAREPGALHKAFLTSEDSPRSLF